MRDAALAWYRAEALEDWVNAQRACRDWPVVATNAVGRRPRGVVEDLLRDRALLTGQPDGGALLAVGVPVLHPAVTRALAMAIARPEDRIRAVVAGRAAISSGAIVDDEYAGESGAAPVVDLAVAKLGSLGFSRDELFPGHWPIPSLGSRPQRTRLGEHPIDTELVRAAAQAEVLAAYARVNAPALITNEQHRLLQSAFDALLGHCGGTAPDPSLWIPSDARHVASFLRRDKGEGLSDEKVWAWFYQPRLPHGRVSSARIASTRGLRARRSCSGSSSSTPASWWCGKAYSSSPGGRGRRSSPWGRSARSRPTGATWRSCRCTRAATTHWTSSCSTSRRPPSSRRGPNPRRRPRLARRLPGGRRRLDHRRLRRGPTVTPPARQEARDLLAGVRPPRVGCLSVLRRRGAPGRRRPTLVSRARRGCGVLPGRGTARHRQGRRASDTRARSRRGRTYRVDRRAPDLAGRPPDARSPSDLAIADWSREPQHLMATGASPREPPRSPDGA